jgi:hypothetical protein
LTTNIEVQRYLINWGYLDPPADGHWGMHSRTALSYFQKFHSLPITGEPDTATLAALKTSPPPLKLGTDLASRIIRKMLRHDMWVSRGEKLYNIVYLEGVDADGTPNPDATDVWNDRRIVIEIASDTPKIIANWLATTEPGAYYINHPMNPGGAFRIAFGQYRAWRFGRHGRTQYPALQQAGPVSGHRDTNKDGRRTGDPFVTGSDFGINQHHGWDMANVGKGSAGCLVGQSIEDHQNFMDMLSCDRRQKVNSQYLWYTTILAGDDLP